MDGIFWMGFYEWITLINECEVGEIDAQVGDARRVTSDDDDVNVGFWEEGRGELPV